MPHKSKPKSRSGPNIPEAQRTSLKVQFRLSLRERQYLEAKAQTAGLSPSAYAQRIVVTSLALPGDQEGPDPDCAGDEAYERAREHDARLERSGYYDRG